MNERRQLIIAVAGAIGVTILFFFLLLKPTLSQISQVQSDIEAARDQEQTLRTQLAHLQTVRKNAPQTMAKLARVSQYLPSTPDLPGFIRQVQVAATKSGVDLQSIAPSPPAELEKATGIQTIAVTLTCQAGFRRMEDFFARLETLDRVVEVRTLSLAPVTSELSDQTVLQSTLTLTMYVVQPDAKLGASGGVVATRSPTPRASP